MKPEGTKKSVICKEDFIYKFDWGPKVPTITGRKSKR